jgi:hypothetical protein
LEEIGLAKKWIEKNQVAKEVNKLKGEYFNYLKKLVNEGKRN